MLATLQKQFTTFWNKQSKSQRIILVSLIAAAAILVPVLVSWANTPSYAVAFSGLSETDAGQIVQKLTENNTAYKLKDAGTILVQSDKVYEVRLQMASAGLPQSSTVGFELFSGNTLGMTEFTQKVNYQRALEGELERTIGSLDAVQSVRVHLVTPEKSLLVSDQTATTASVTVTEKLGQKLNKAQVQSISHLVASSVEGLKPESVVIIDSKGVMLASGTSNDLSMVTSQTDSQRQAESSAADEVRQRVQTMLDTILGPNHSTVQTSVAMDWTQREITSNTYNPTPAAVRSSQKSVENYTTNGQTTGGIPGASSNLPTPVPLATGTAGGIIYSKTDETNNYEISQVESKEIVSPGQVKRVSVSVMVDNITDTKQLSTIKSAVVAAAGLDTARGDQVVVDTMMFDQTYSTQQASDLAKQQQTDLYTQIAMIAGAVLFVIAVLVIFGRVLGNMRNASREAWKPVLRPVAEMALQTGSPMNGSGMSQQLPASYESGTTQGLPPMTTKKNEEDVLLEISRHSQLNNQEDESRAKIITRLTEENPATVAEIIQVWLSEDEKRNG
jgi:flagellar M-ring protein FliF